MAIYICPKCNKRYFLNDKEQDSIEFQHEFKCEFCGTGYKESVVKQSEPAKDNTEIPNISQNQNNTGFINSQSMSNKSGDWELLLKIERKQLDTLENIKSMIKFFFILTIISLVLSFIIAFI